MMRKKLLFALLLLFVFSLTLTACDKTNASSDSTQEQSTTTHEVSEDISECNHLFGSWMSIEEADCLKAGKQVRICSKCSFGETQDIAPLGHTSSSDYCSRCGQYSGSWTQQKVQEIIQIHDIYVDNIDSADGVDMRISWTNTSSKTIKYIHFYVEPYNAVGDKMYCEVRDYCRFDAYVTGPCDSGYKGYFTVGDESIGDICYYGNLWENCWYNGSIKTISLVGIKIIYMDDSVVELDTVASNMAFAQYPNFSNKKAVYHREMVAYYANEKCQIFAISLFDMSWHSFSETINIDIRIDNSLGETVFQKNYTKDKEQYFVSNMITGIDELTCGLIIEDPEIKNGESAIGTLYFIVTNSDSTIEFFGELPIEGLPTS